MQTTQHTAAPRPRPQRSPMSSATVALGWGTFGFILGALCWHLLGFWHFVSGVVLKGGNEARAIEQVEPARQNGPKAGDPRTGKTYPVRLVTPGIPAAKAPALAAAPCNAAPRDRVGSQTELTDCANEAVAKTIAPTSDLVVNSAPPLPATLPLPTQLPQATAAPAVIPATSWSTTVSTTTP
jgi:hypothetical protein